jgi:hypothetical protein
LTDLNNILSNINFKIKVIENQTYLQDFAITNGTTEYFSPNTCGTLFSTATLVTVEHEHGHILHLHHTYASPWSIPILWIIGIPLLVQINENGLVIFNG